MIETPQITESPAQLTAIIHLTIPREEIAKVMGPAIHEVMTAVAAQGITPTGPVFAHYLKMDSHTFDFEVGVPVPKAVAPAGRLQPSQLRATKVARTVYHGAYEGLHGAWEEFGGWMKTNGHTPAPDLWEHYIAGPESSPDAADWRTELNRPVES